MIEDKKSRLKEYKRNYQAARKKILIFLVRYKISRTDIMALSNQFSGCP